MDFGGIVSFKTPREESFKSTSMAEVALKLKMFKLFSSYEILIAQTHELYRTTATKPSGRRNAVENTNRLEVVEAIRTEFGMTNLEKCPIA